MLGHELFHLAQAGFIELILPRLGLRIAKIYSATQRPEFAGGAEAIDLPRTTARRRFRRLPAVRVGPAKSGHFNGRDKKPMAGPRKVAALTPIRTPRL